VLFLDECLTLLLLLLLLLFISLQIQSGNFGYTLVLFNDVLLSTVEDT